MNKGLIIILVLLVCVVYSDTIIPAGNVSGTWTPSGSPYLIAGEIEVSNGEILTIAPGCLIEFQGHYKLIVQGCLLAIGTEQDSIKFTIADTTGFSDLSTTAGGWKGFIFDQTPATNDSSKISYSTIEYVKSLEYGAGSYVNNFDKLIISNSTFKNNYADQGGAFNLHNSSCIFRNNLFTHNKARYGGALSLYASAAIIVNNVIVDNICTIYAGGMLLSGEYDENALIVNNTICHNTPGFEGAVHIDGGVILINNIIWHNQGCGVSGCCSHATFLYNNIENVLSNYPNYFETNENLDPFFIDENDYHLNAFSSCINRGIIDTTGLYLALSDFDGNARIYNGENPRIDIGAYEYQGEPILFYPDFTFEGDFGVVPYTVQFTDISEGDIVNWEWDFNNDGVIDSYEQNPEYTYLEGGIFSVTLTIGYDEYELSRTKSDIIEVSNIYTYYQGKFSFSKVNENDELCSIELFDFDGDNLKEIYATYKNIDERYYRIFGIDVNGETILNETIQIDNEEENLEKIILMEHNNTGYIVLVLMSSEVSGGSSTAFDYDVIIRVHLLENLQMITEHISSITEKSGCSAKSLTAYFDEDLFIYAGLRISYNIMLNRYSSDKTIRCIFDGSEIIETVQINNVGTLLYPHSNLGVGYDYIYDDMCGITRSISFRSLDEQNIICNSGDTANYGLVSRNDEYFEYYGCVIYVGGNLRCYSSDFSTLLWEDQIALSDGFCSSTITYENEETFLILYDKEGNTVNIINRITGQIIHTQSTSTAPFSIKKTSTNELILFEENNGEYLVSTNDSNYYTDIDDHEIQVNPQNHFLRNYPNPFNPSTKIEFSIQNASKIELIVYNIKGQIVKILADDEFTSGTHSIIWNGDDNSGEIVCSGIYYYQLRVNGKVMTVKKCLLLK